MMLKNQMIYLVVYVSYDESGAWKIEIAKELKAAGYNIDFNQLF